MRDIKKHTEFKENDKLNSGNLAEVLGISAIDIRNIDDWFDTYLDRHLQAKTFDGGLAYESELGELHSSIFEHMKPLSYKYILPRLLKYYNISDSGYLKPMIVARLRVLLKDLIIKYMNEQNVSYTPAEFIFVTTYLRDNFLISPNGELIENVLKINAKHKITTKSSTEERRNIISNILHVIADEGFHHDIICFKKVLKLITADDIELMEQIKSFKVKNNQGCYLLINTIFNTHLPFDNVAENFDMKRELIFWLDSSGGAKPKQTWLEKMLALKAKIGLPSLLLICEQILENEQLVNHYFNEICWWGDGVCKRFMKSAKWIKEYCKE
jgi:hypothetical protein